MKKKILVLGGGFSKERSISLKSAKAVIKSINNIYKVKFCDPCDNFFKIIEKFRPDVIFNALHGRFGEDGYVQSILEIINVKYTHSGVISSMSAMDKEISKKIFKKNNILTPRYLKIKNNYKNVDYKKIKNFINYPLVVKPINEGSSLDVYICNNKFSLKTKLKKMANYKEIKRAVETASHTGNNKIVLLHCISGYPTPLSECNLNTILDLKEKSNYLFKIEIKLIFTK